MTSNGRRELAVLDQVSLMLAQANSLEDVKAIRDKAEAARTYAKAARLGLELQNRAAELKLRAERKAGRFLASLHLRGGDRRSNGHDASLKLEHLGVSPDQSKRWQRVASISEEDFCKYVKSINALGKEVTSAGFLRTCVTARGRRRPTHRLRVNELDSTAKSRAIRKDNPESQDMIFELMNHCQLLSDVLQPVYGEGELAMQRGERRVVGRLLREMRELIGRLQEEWSH